MLKPKAGRQEHRPKWLGNQGDTNKVFVGNLSWKVNDKDLEEEFRKYGTVMEAVVLMMPNDNTKSRGFGFVTFTTKEAAGTAVEKGNGRELKGRPMKVDPAGRKGVTTGEGQTGLDKGG
ncbi:hypothetical protein BC829DRAFT_366989, partial [Chytridium lagenaria]